MTDLTDALERERLSPGTLQDEVRERLAHVEPRVRAYRTLNPQFGLTRPQPGPLSGAPLAVKDLIDVRGLPTEGGSPAYHFMPARHAPVVGRLVRAGALVVGKANTKELAFGITCPPTANPWDLACIPGGSSGGSAAALAAGLAWLALGTDTAGSIRIPAALCGVAGLKPTHGRLGVKGVMALSWTFDAVGPMARSARDLARLYAVLNRSRREVEASQPISVAVPENYLEGWLAPGVHDDFLAVGTVLRDAGIPVREVDMEPFSTWTRLFRAVRLPEAYVYHQPMLESPARERLADDGLAARLLAGRDVPAAAYIEALRERDALRQRWLKALRPGEILALPTVPVTAPLDGEDPVDVAGERRDLWETLVRYTLPWNVLGWPALTVPMGVSRGLPTALQLVGRPGTERMLLSAAMWYESARGPWRLPDIR